MPIAVVLAVLYFDLKLDYFWPLPFLVHPATKSIAFLNSFVVEFVFVVEYSQVDFGFPPVIPA